MAHPYLALRPTRNGLVSHYAVAGSKNPLPLGMRSVKAYECTNPNCRADLNLYGDVVFDEEPPTPNDPVVQDDDSQGKREQNQEKRLKRSTATFMNWMINLWGIT